MLPARKHLKTEQAAVAQIDDRLKGGNNLIALKCSIYFDRVNKHGDTLQSGCRWLCRGAYLSHEITRPIWASSISGELG
jgi:hypothetical protein